MIDVVSDFRMLENAGEINKAVNQPFGDRDRVVRDDVKVIEASCGLVADEIPHKQGAEPDTKRLSTVRGSAQPQHLIVRLQNSARLMKDKLSQFSGFSPVWGSFKQRTANH